MSETDTEARAIRAGCDAFHKAVRPEYPLGPCKYPDRAACEFCVLPETIRAALAANPSGPSHEEVVRVLKPFAKRADELSEGAHDNGIVTSKVRDIRAARALLAKLEKDNG